VLVVLLLLAGLFAGPILSIAAWVTKDEFEVSQKTPHEISVAELIKNGPGDNRHVTLTDFEPGGWVVETENNHWKEVYVAMFPAGGPDDKIEVVLASPSINSDPMLRQFLAQKKITGICSKTRRSGWGATLGPELVKANDGVPLASPWSVRELRNPPSEGLVDGLFNAAYITFGLVIAIALVVFAQDLFASMRG
jgi:hypothetical protein